MMKITPIAALIFIGIIGCDKIQIAVQPGEVCSEKVQCDSARGLVCLASTSKCACDAMFTWSEATNECAESNVGGAVRNHTDKCNQGVFENCYELGLMFRKGKDVAKDEVGAAQLLRKACDGKVEKACTALLVSRDGDACSFSFACNDSLGLHCDESTNRCRCKTNTEWNEKTLVCEETETGKNLRINRKKCEAKDLDGCHQLGKIYASGAGVPKDPGKAVSLFENACKLKHQPSCDLCIMMSGCRDLVGKPDAQ